EQQDLWPVGESYALEQLDQFVEDSVSHYKVERDFPHVHGTSKLSPYLNIGILSVRQCLQALFRNQHGNFHLDNEGQQTWLDELIWREFYQHILFDFPYVSKHLPFKKGTQKIKWNHNPEQLKAWQTGQTGIPIVDAGMRQLLQTGWMHNRVRMITAMFLCKNLLIDWRIGEQWFMQHLIDGDLAANNGGWQWCASTGTDAVPYFRIFNPISQSQKFDPNGDYIRKWVKELAHLDNKSIHDPYSSKINLSLNYPKPIVDLKETRLKAIETFKHI
ncbi:FAD-binding domain-containing protein, partial [Acinetobacter baumannii]